MKRRILCPTDFSKNAQNAIDYAVELFKNQTIDFYILNTYYIDSFTMELTAIRALEESKRKSTAGLINILERLSVIDDSKNHKFHMVSECGPLIQTMKDLIEKRDIEIVVMGNKGITGSNIEIYGSQTVLAMEEIRNCPVLAIPEEAVCKEMKEIVFLTGYKTPYKSRQFKYLVDIAKITNATITVLSVLGEDKNLDTTQLVNQMLLKDYFEGLDYSFCTVNNVGIQKAVNAFIKERDSDMVAFINKKHNFFRMTFSKPMVKNLNYQLTIPVLALNHR